MVYTENTKPGIGDPYWYEWSVGLKYIVKMLNPESEIKYVELQANVSFGLDDVVVTYNDGRKHFIQVKYTNIDDSLTFGDLVTKDSSSGRSLLQQFAIGWNEEKGKYAHSDVLLFTNRTAGQRVSTTKTKPPFKRPALASFLSKLKEQLNSAELFEEINFPNCKEAWEEWKQQLDCIPDDSDKLTFLKCLQIDTNNSGLSQIYEDLRRDIKVLFQTDDAIAEEILKSLDHALRDWSTSGRNASRIDKEEVYNRLSVKQEFLSHNQDLIPNDPFFPSREKLVELLENELRSNQHKVVFVSGIPGIGKTNIISKLNVKRESLIDIRYYAYEPIDPAKEYFTGDVSRRVDKNNFWNELFNQLRKLLKGQLYKYGVPVINDLMTLEQKRCTFFKIASEYAAERGRTFIVAIDGIDHAARAANIENTFLPTLPNPEFIPSNVKIVIAGQPKSDYRNYPDWLFQNTSDVFEINVPPLQTEDIQSLVDARFPDEPSDYRMQLTGLISQYAEGNTLAAIFAVYEAVQEPILFKLEERLKKRKLSGNIQEYYKTIWKGAIGRIQSLFVDYKVAGVFAFLNEPVNERKLSSIYSNERLSITDWRNVLKELRPLLSEKSGNYTILHNDVRVFLSSIIGQDQDHVQEVYSNLTDYYLTLSEKNEAFYHDIFRFMKAAKRLNEFEKVFSPNFIIEAFVNGVELDEIHGITTDILKGTIANVPINWTQVRSLAFGYMTIDQIEKSQYEIDSVDFRTKEKAIPIHPFECKVEPLSAWDNALISDVLSLVEKLYDAGAIDRATTLFKHWFSGLRISEIYGLVEVQKDRDFLSPSTREIASSIGANACRSGEFCIIQGVTDFQKEHSSFVYYMMDSAFMTIIKEYSGDTLQEALKNLEVIYSESILNGLLVLLSDNRLTDISSIALWLDNRTSKAPVGMLFASFMKIVSFTADYTQGQKEELWKQIETIEFGDVTYENEKAYYSIYALTAAYLQSKSYSLVAYEILEKYMKQNSHRDRGYYGMYFSNVCLIGKWLSERQSGRSITIRAQDLRDLLHALFIKKWSPNVLDSEIHRLRSHVLKAYVFLSKTAESQIRSVIDDVCQQVFSDNPVNSLLDAGFYYFQDDSARQQQWYDYWLGSEGFVWSESLGERNSIIQHFMQVLQLYDTDHRIDPSEVMEKARWSIIGYNSHKEYTCDYLLKWYNSLIEKQNRVDPALSMQIKKISDQVEEIGDNRLHYQINSKVFEDLFSCGFQTIKETLQNNRYLCQGFESPEYFVDGLIGYLKKGQYDQVTLLKFWAIGMAVLDWRNEDNHATMHSLQRAIELCAERSGIQGIHTLLKEYGPAYIDLASDHVRFVIPERWCDEHGEMKEDLVSDEVIQSYMDGEKHSEDSIVASIEILSKQGKVANETLMKLLEFELEKGTYEIEHNPIIAYLFSHLPITDLDPIIARHIEGLTEKDHYYMENQLPTFARWKIAQQDDIYGTNGIKELINMFYAWMTSAGHFQEPTIEDKYNYTVLIDWKNVEDIDSLFYQIIKLLIQSEDADAARTALSGLFALERLNASYTNWIERDWSSFHYRAKEWVLMTYELLLDFEEDRRELILHYLESHCSDEDFNVALYANLLLENIKEDHTCTKVSQSYFSSIPTIGIRKLISTPKDEVWLSGDRYVEVAISSLEKMVGENCSDIEERTIAYSEQLDKDCLLVPLNQHHVSGYKVICDRISLAFLRVLYKEWVSGRFNGLETQIARSILSASEPFALLTTPYLWEYNDHKLISDADSFIKQPAIVRNNTIKEILKTGINDDELVVAGSIIDYTYNTEIFGFQLSYLYVPWILPSDESQEFERNSRFFLQQRTDFTEDRHRSITLHHNGVESFKDSNICCGFSRVALNLFGWKIHLSKDGVVLLDSSGAKIGRLECYYAFRDLSSRYPGNQPILQRWVINQAELLRHLSQLKPLSFKTVADTCLTQYE